MYTKPFILKLYRFQVCGILLKEFFAQSILIAQSAVIAIYNRTELTKFFKTQVATLLMVFTHKRKNRADKTTGSTKSTRNSWRF